ncbi:lipase maturation factor family protein [Homoserinibacter sp. YIM 151385]|uniref:lipase maturation factor family protein n=1 Tax=Homoserinibacter sp. YIM 151385 TaxID=2985506 RepID=UPI0022F01A0F|nr:lipase maturation factor family protein [Homoserinibacter sp. YIM 151385]WBU37432.1 lipase maturation factor family protein [Homoserinibacter sp. YIM 151385]
MDGALPWLDAQGFELARQVLQRGTAGVFAIAYLSTLLQFPALLGERGLLPAPAFIARNRDRLRPTLFRWGYSDRRLRALCLAGIAVSLLLVAGIPQQGPPWAPMLAFLLLWIGYLSIVHIGQAFYGFGWEMLLCEAGFVVAFLGSDAVAPPLPVLVICWWLVLRLELGAGLIKLRGGREWRDLTALMYHHETQPMPNPLSRRIHLLPAWFHRGEVVANHIVQLAAPVLIFAPQPVGAIGAAAIILTQGWLLVSGNFSWLNALTIVLAASALGDGAVRLILPGLPAPEYAPTPLWFAVVAGLVALGLALLSIPAARNLLSRRQLMNASFNRWQLGNAYGAFGTVTKVRQEVVIEGTTAERPEEEDWMPYGFRGKPGDVRRVPRQVAPYHLRLDWLMWFLALGAPGEHWFRPLLRRLLEADRATLRLLAHDPFGGRPPRLVRARVFRYRFATHAEHREHGVVWMREARWTLVDPVSLDPGD